MCNLRNKVHGHQQKEEMPSLPLDSGISTGMRWSPSWPCGQERLSQDLPLHPVQGSIIPPTVYHQFSTLHPADHCETQTQELWQSHLPGPTTTIHPSSRAPPSFGTVSRGTATVTSNRLFKKNTPVCNLFITVYPCVFVHCLALPPTPSQTPKCSKKI